MKRTNTLQLLLSLVIAALVAFLAAPVQAAPPELGPASAAADDEAASSDDAYRAGREAIDAGKWREAVERFSEVAGSYADAALYWSAYAQFKAGEVADAERSLRRLEKKYPDSRWNDDARALVLEIRGRAGHVDVPDDNTQLKMLALQSLMHAEPERALPMLRRVLESGGPSELLQQALFVLSQVDDPEARRMILDVARGSSHAELQRAAVQTLGIAGAYDELRELYGSSTDRETKSAILQSLGIGGDEDFLLRVVREETDPELRMSAIQGLGLGGSEKAWRALREIYRGSVDHDLKRTILQTTITSDYGKDFVLEVVRSETDPELRRAAIQMLGFSFDDSPEIDALLDELYANGDQETRVMILQSWGIQGRTDRLIRIAEEETDLELRKAAVQALSMNPTEEATEYLLRLLEEQ